MNCPATKEDSRIWLRVAIDFRPTSNHRPVWITAFDSDRRDYELMRDARQVPQAAAVRIAASGICDVTVLAEFTDGWVLFRRCGLWDPPPNYGEFA